MLITLLLLAAFGYSVWWLLKMRLTVSPEEALERGRAILNSKRVLFIVAHPDDADWWVSGTARLFVLRGAEVGLVVASDGEKGRNLINAKNLAETRQTEQREAAKVIGISKLWFLHLPDREVAMQPGISRSLEEIIHEFEPDLIVTFDPSLPDLPYLHPDHEGIGRVVYSIWKENPGGAKLIFFHSRRPNIAVDITEVIETKVEALRKHRSQGLGRGGERNKEFHRAFGKRVGVPYAELFREIK
ncbi:MAG TPA: PIG-L deacetylase family protein [Fimbriimonadales bacterium]|nr:PIG-L deacetylase family protein [Fimbriimonadales bacterium]